MSAAVDRGTPRLRDLLAITRSVRFLLIIPLGLAVAAFVLINSAIDPTRVSIVEQTMVVSGLDYSELPAAHGHHRELLTSPDEHSAPTVELTTPFGEHATVFALRAEQPISSTTGDAEARSAEGQVDVAAERLLDTATARDAADLFRSPSDVAAELEQARRGLDEATDLLDASRERRARLLAIDADPGLSEAASQDSWSAAAERDVMVRRVAELELRAEAELLMTPYQVSRIGQRETRIDTGAKLGLLAGVAAATGAALIATLALIALAMTRRTITSVDHARAVSAGTPIVDLTTPDPADGIAHLERLLDADRAQIVEIDMTLDKNEHRMIRLATRIGALDARSTSAIVCCRLGSTNGSSLRRLFARLDDESLHPTALVCFPETPNAALVEEDAAAADQLASSVKIGAFTVEPDSTRRPRALTSHAVASIADDS